MSVIEQVAKAIYQAYSRKSGADDGWEDFRGEAKAALQCLSADIDEGGLEAAIEAYKKLLTREPPLVVSGQLPDLNPYGWHEIASVIQAYLNTISKEPS